MNHVERCRAVPLLTCISLWLGSGGALAQVVREDFPVLYNVEAVVRTTALDEPGDVVRFGPLPVNDGTYIDSNSESDLTFSTASAFSGSSSESAGIRLNVRYSDGGPATALASWSGQIKNDSPVSRILVVDLMVFTDVSGPTNFFIASATLGGTHYRDLRGYPASYTLNGGMVFPGAFVDFRMITGISMEPGPVGFGYQSLSVLGLEWSSAPVPEVPSVALLAIGLGLGATSICLPRKK